jgi:periplasmic protein TonB
MKTKKKFRSAQSLKLFVTFLVFAAVMVTFSACGKNKNSVASSTEIKPSSPPATGQKDGDAYLNVDEMPVFPGGDEALLKFIAENTHYPEQAKANSIQGRVIVRFMVKADGTVSDVSIMKSIDPLLDNESIRVVSLLPKFTPGKLNGVSVPVWYMVPITYALK